MNEPSTSKVNEETKRRPLGRRMLGVAAGLSLVAAFSVGCGSSGESTSGGASDTTAAAEGGDAGDGCVEVTDGKVTIVTENFDYQPDCVTSEGPDLEITYENKEEGVKHDIDFKDLGEMTPLKAGPSTETLKLTGLEAGTYDWVCSIHSQMQGELTVK